VPYTPNLKKYQSQGNSVLSSSHYCSLAFRKSSYYIQANIRSEPWANCHSSDNITGRQTN